jgi:uncharacterized membrane protein
MMFAGLVLGAPGWLAWAVLLAAIALGVLVWAYAQAGSSGAVRTIAGLLKAAGILALALCLVEPLLSGMRPRKGSNLFLVVADNSRSLGIHDRGSRDSRGEAMQKQLASETTWQTRLGQDFDVRRYAFDTRLQPLKDFAAIDLQGESSALASSLASLGERFQDRPIAGILLFTDGNATDISEAVDWKSLPPVFPVVLGSDAPLADVSVVRATVSQTNFEAAPVAIAAELECFDIGQRAVVLRILDEDGKEIERRTIQNVVSGEPLVERFQLKPEKPGISFYTVQARLAGEEQLADDAPQTAEAALANNSRLITVDRGGGPYRVLYVSGRPNWEFKFLRRALQEDDEVDLVGLVRVARQEPKFTFRGRDGERTNPIFRGFGNQGDEEAENYNEPVLLRLGTEDREELRGGFPKGEEELFGYHAIIFDDIEAAFFTQEQMSLVQSFVSQRGGGFLMLGGPDSFAQGKFARTPVGELLPVYLDRSPAVAATEGYRLMLTREGWLQPWVRVRPTEHDETKRLAEMPSFQSLSRASAVKPGAAVLASVHAPAGSPQPALVEQPFGRGRAGALLLGDLWRWNLHRAEGAESDLEKSWRQTVRWLVADVPQRVEVEARRPGGSSNLPLELVVLSRDEGYLPLDNAAVAIRVHTPDNREIELTAEPSDKAAGEYRATFAPRLPGAYRATVTVRNPDESDVGQREVGWAVEPATDEFRTLRANRALLEKIAADSGGEVVRLDRLDQFVASLPNRKIPIVEAWNFPLWHQWGVFVFAAACLIGEWGLRRWKGLP